MLELLSGPLSLMTDLDDLRPRYHFTAKSGWLNDPNGLVFYKGEYHLFFQHNPFSTQWGNMTWGHAVSKDLVHWKQVENAIEPDSLGTMFSGSAVVDKSGSAGFGKGALVLAYTAAGGTNEASKGKPFSQCIAWSLDGRTFQKFTGNPVLPHLLAENRDPKVVWHSPTKRWVMALYLANTRFALFTSSDLRHWEKSSELAIDGTDECPDFFQMFLDGDKGKPRWVFSGANGNYQVGRFDGKVFVPETGVLPSNHGPNSYAAQAFFGDPKGRIVQIAWMRGVEFPGCEWNQQMSVPRVLTLKTTAEGPRLFTNPAPELRKLRSKPIAPSLGVNRFAFKTADAAAEVELTISVPKTGTLRVGLGGTAVQYVADDQELWVGDARVKVPLDKGQLHLNVFRDTASIEVFAQNGRYSIPVFAPMKSPDTSIPITWIGDGWVFPKARAYTLANAWPDLTGE